LDVSRLFVQDRVITGDDSVARILLGGKAIVTVRERSSLTITEAPSVGASQRTFQGHRVTVTKERAATRLFCKLLVARDVDSVDASAVVSLARIDRLAADRAHKMLVVLAIRHRSPPSALQAGRSSVT